LNTHYSFITAGNKVPNNLRYYIVVARCVAVVSGCWWRRHPLGVEDSRAYME